MTDWPEIDDGDRLTVEPKSSRVQRFMHRLKVAIEWTIAIPIIVVFVLWIAAIVWENWDGAKLSAAAPAWVVCFIPLIIFILLREFEARMKKQLDRLEEYERATQTRLDNLARRVERLQVQMLDRE